MRSRFRFHRLAALALVIPVALGACGGDDDDDAGASASEPSGSGTEAASTEADVTLRLGYFPNVTHAPAILGDQSGYFEDALGDNVTLEVTNFNAGPEAVEALFAGALDASFIGPNPAINAYAQSGGDLIRVVAGTASGGAYLVVKPEITSAADLEGKTLATPQLGNTQDVALRAWLAEQGYETDTAGGGDVSILPQANAQTLTTFINGDIDGAWVPEPWATRLINEGGGVVLVDEADLWPGGAYVTTHLVVRTEFLNDHPAVVKALIQGLAAAIDAIGADREAAEAAVAAGIESITGKAIAPELVTASFDHITYTLDPVASSLRKSASDAESLGLLDPVVLEGIYDLTLLNEVLAERNESEVSDT